MATNARHPDKLALIVERIGPYHDARLRALAEAVGRDRLLAIEIAAESSEYAWNPVASNAFSRRTLVCGRDYRALAPRDIIRATVNALEDEQPSAVAIGGWAAAESRAATVWCRSRRKIAIVMSDSQRRDSPRHFPIEWLKARRVAAFDAALVAGSSHRDYLVELGMGAQRIFTGYDVVDNEFFRRESDLARAHAERVLREHGLPSAYLLASCRFIPKKNLFGLLRGYVRYRERMGSAAWDLIVLGDGPLMTPVDEERQRLGLESSVHLPGFRQYAELPAFYGLAKAFVHASTSEQWGLVINEAMACSLPVVVSSACGAAELVENGVTGFTFEAHDCGALCDALVALHRVDLGAMGAAAFQRISGVSPGSFATNMLRAVEAGRDFRDQRPRFDLTPVYWQARAGY